MQHYRESLKNGESRQVTIGDVQRFVDAFSKSHIRSVDLFMSRNPRLAPFGKYIVAFEILRAEKDSCFAEDAKSQQKERERRNSSDSRSVREYCDGTADFDGGDWYSYIYNRFFEQEVDEEGLPDFSGGEVVFITFNYDRSLEHFLHESLRNSFTEVSEDHIVRSLNHLRILHVYGQISPLKWQDAKAGVVYKPQQTDEPLLQKAAASIKTIYEQEVSAALDEARELVAQAGRVFFLGFGYARENMDILDLPAKIPSECQVYGTAYGLIEEERRRVFASVHNPRKVDQERTTIELGDVDCLTLLRKYL